MIERDRALLARAGRINRQLGTAVVTLLDAQHGGELPADELRTLGDLLHHLGQDMRARADELADRPISTDPAVVDGSALTHPSSD
ncbi:hypothetical protein F8178_18855 [Haloechinothrix sp. LS1_15]|nr:hypothetical protein [Haloechinothrix sp. LS1_15]